MTDEAIPDSLPPHWQSVSMKWLLRFRNGADYGDVVDDSGAVPVIGSGGEFARASAHLFDGESVLFGRKGTVDRPLHVDGRFWTVDTMYYTELGPRIFGRFLYYFARTIPYSLLSTSTALPSMTQSTLGAVRVPLPPMEEQRAIADFLDREAAQIDAMVDAQERLVALLEERRSAVVTAAVTEGLSRAPLVETGNRWLPRVPEGWELTQFRRVVRVVNGLVDPTEPPYADMVLIAPNHVEKGTGRVIAMETSAEQHAESGKYYVHSGQVIYSKIRPALNKVALATQDCLCSADMYALDSERGRMTNRFLAYYLLARPFHAFASETSMRVAMPKVNREEIAAGPVAVPPLSEQNAIAEHLDYATSRIDRAISAARESIALMKERRAALISAAVTGRINVRTGIEQVERDLEEARA